MIVIVPHKRIFIARFYISYNPFVHKTKSVMTLASNHTIKKPMFN